jgi:small subunit ribosomal protein S17
METKVKQRGRLNTVVGEVISDKMDKTITVRISRLVKHARYGKYIKSHSVFKAHDENNTAKTGDKVMIAATKPTSKTKRWKLMKVVKEATIV